MKKGELHEWASNSGPRGEVRAAGREALVEGFDKQLVENSVAMLGLAVHWAILLKHFEASTINGTTFRIVSA